jgi:hypothetical protein
MPLTLEDVRSVHNVRPNHHKVIFENNFVSRITIQLTSSDCPTSLVLLQPGECLLPVELTLNMWIAWLIESAAPLPPHEAQREITCTRETDSLGSSRGLVSWEGLVKCQLGMLGRSTRVCFS